MTDFNKFVWNDDDYRPRGEKALLPASFGYRESVAEPAKKKKNRTWLIAASSAVIGAMVFAFSSAMLSPLIENALGDKSPFKLETPAYEYSAQSGNITAVTNPLSGRTPLSTVEIAKRVGPAVVGVNSKIQSFGLFSQGMSEGSGSGIIISSDGTIVTNNHVIDRATSVTVVLNTGKEYPATLVGTDPRSDLAVIKIDARDLPYAILGDSSLLEVGEPAIAIGNPLGQEFAGSVTVGVISALNRTVVIEQKKLNLIQTDAAINPGNSGGALVNQYGEVIGINTVKVAISGVEGLGFAIPVSEAKPIVEDLVNFKYVKGRPLIGLSVRYLSPEEADYYNVSASGLFVLEVAPYSGAENAGIKRGDVVQKCNGKEVKSADELNKIRDEHKAGDTLTLEIDRGGEKKTIEVILTEDKPALGE